MSATRFATVVLIGRLGSEHELGLYSIGFGALVLVVGIHEAFVTTPLTVFLPRKRADQQAAYLGFALRCTWQLAALLSTVLLVVAIIARSFQELSELPWVFVGVAAALPLVLLREFSRRLQFVHARMKTAFVLDCSVAFVQVGGLLLWLTLARPTALIGLIATGLACGVAAFFWWNVESIDFAQDPQSRGSEIQEHAKFGSWIFGENLVSTVHTYFGHWFLTITSVATASTGIYSACLNVILLVNPFLLAITSIMVPRVAQAYSQHHRQAVAALTWKFVAFVGGVMSLFAVFTAAFGGWLAEFLFGAEYGGHSKEIAWLGVMMIFQGINYTASVGLRVLNFASWTLISGLVGLSTTAFLAIVVFPNDLFGIVQSFVIGVAAIAVLRLLLLVRLSY